MTFAVHANTNKASAPAKAADDKKSILYTELMSKVRENHGTIYGACMNYQIKVQQTKGDDEVMLRSIKDFNHGYIVKLLLDDAKSANWNCTFGLWLTAIAVFLLAGFIGGIIFKLVTKFCVPSSIRFQSCIKV